MMYRDLDSVIVMVMAFAVRKGHDWSTYELLRRENGSLTDGQESDVRRHEEHEWELEEEQDNDKQDDDLLPLDLEWQGGQVS